MKRIVLGTAGHIDHGKTLLTRALTGVDTDRLAEEKARGITIELGFAPMRLADGTEISLVDVPGHEKFVRTMMAGVSGIDGVLLVIAADDGVMPQTREHFDILCLLGLRRGLVVLTKCDLVGAERLETVRGQVRELVRGSFLENAPVCAVSAATGLGIPALKQEIETLVSTADERSSGKPFRLPTDRVFPVEGFGAVATGTLTEGTMRVGDAAEIYPGGASGAVRTLQIHGAGEKETMAGTRTAVSFTGLARDALQRGCTVAEPDSMLVTDVLTARLRILPDCPFPIRNSSQLRLFHGTEEQICRLRLLDADVLRSGQSGYAQLQLARPIPVRWDDRFLLRFFSPVVTVGGGTVLACGDRRLKRNSPEVLERLGRLHDPDPAARLSQRVEDCGLVPIRRESLRKYGNLSPAELAAAEEGLAAHTVELPGGALVGAAAVERKLAETKKCLADFHAEYPLQTGMRLAEWRSRLFPEREVPVDTLLGRWLAEGSLKSENGYLALPDFTPVFTQEHKIMQRRLLHHYREAWFFAPDLNAVKEKYARFGTLFEQTLSNMRIGGLLIPLTPRFWVHHEAYADALRILSELGAEGKPVTLAELRTAAGISRKYSQMFLEYWDRKGITRRVGDAHILLRTENDSENG